MSVPINEIEIQNELLQEQLIYIDMKTIGIIGVILSLIGCTIGVYCQITILPNYNVLDAKFIQDGLSEVDKLRWWSLADQKFIFGSVALLLGALGSVVGLIIGLKKQKVGWIALAFGLIAFILGATQSTHMFS
jgi:disulfide bond formation protein DsbB